MTPERELLLQAIRKAGKPVGPGELAARLGKRPGAIRKMLNTLKQAGQVKQAGYGKWQVTPGGNTSRKAVTLPVTLNKNTTGRASGNTSGRVVTLSGKGKGLSDTEKIAIARREYNQEYYAKNRRELQVKSKTYREAHHQEILKYNREWKKVNPDKVKAQRQRIWIKKYNQAHPGK